MSHNCTPSSAAEVFMVFLRLGLTSFGGPTAHLGYFRDEFVTRLKWMTEKSYADLVALCQFLPGPASSQVGMAVGLQRAGYLGMFVAWFAFTMPSVGGAEVLLEHVRPRLEEVWYGLFVAGSASGVGSD